MRIDTRWLPGSGYRPVQVELKPIAPLTDTRTVDLRFKSVGWYNRERTIEVAQSVDIPPGAAAVKVTLSVPEHMPWNSGRMLVYEGGRLNEKLSQMQFPMTSGNQDMLEGVPGMLIVGSQAIDTSTLIDALRARGLMELYQSGNAWSRPQANTQAVQQLATAIRRELDELPGRWLDYSNLDVVCLTAGELDQLILQQPGRWKALREWTAGGGNLWIYDAGSDWSRLPAIESALKFAATNEDGADPALRGWTLPDKSKFHEALDAGYNAATSDAIVEEIEGELGITNPAAPRRPKTAPDPGFAMRTYQLGMVAVFASADPFADDKFMWQWRFNAIGSDRLLWSRRHGLSTRRQNDDFWNFLVPGVGLVPVTPFRVLITLFMVAIGPLNYFWLRRKGRLHLLLVIVPLSAAVITGTLFAYAVVADGFDVRVRARSLTHIDQKRGAAACWTRLSYYAGLTPADGLAFPEDVAVLPLEPQGAGYDRSKPDRYVHWSEDTQTLAGGWLPSRTSTQFLTVRLRPSDRGIDFLTSDGPPRIRNRLGAEARIILVAGPDGPLLVARSVADRATAALAVAHLEHDVNELSRLVSQQQLAVPLGLDPQRYNMFGFRNNNYNYFSQWSNGLPSPSVNSSLLEHHLQRLMLWTPSGQVPLELSSYVAVVDRSPEVLYGTEPVSEEDSLHVIVGEW